MQRFKKCVAALVPFADDILLLLGAICFLIATFSLSKIAGIYLLGAFFMGFAVIIAKRPLKPPEKQERG